MDIVNKLKKELLKQAFTEEQKQTERLNECKHIASIYAQTENAIAVLSVFSPAMVDGIISKLRSYEDRTLRSEVHDNQEEMLKLVNKYFHCG